MGPHADEDHYYDNHYGYGNGGASIHEEEEYHLPDATLTSCSEYCFDKYSVMLAYLIL